MKDKISLYSMLTMITLLGCFGMAQAQPVTITPQLHNKLTKGGTAPNGMGLSTTAARTSGAPATQAVVGWNYVHATNCVVYTDETTVWLYLFPQEGGNWFTTIPSFQNTIAAACQTGNWLAFYVTNTNGNWNQVVTFTYK